MMTEQEQAELVRLRAENLALRCAMEAIRALTGVVGDPAPAAPIEPLSAPVGAVEPLSGESLLARLRSPAMFPRAPRQRVQGGYREPVWFPKACPVEDLVRVGRFAYEERSRNGGGGLLVLDRTAAHLSALSTVEVAHGALEDAGEIPFDRNLAGYFKAAYFDWEEEGTPHPFGSAAAEARKNGHAWLPHTRVRLLADLAGQCRWPELGDMPAWVCDKPAQMREWAAYINGLRCEAIDEHGRGPEYEAVKAAFSSAITSMGGAWTPGQGRQYKTGLVHRPDWTFSIQDLSSVTMWRWFDRLRRLAIENDRREWAPVAIRNEDEMLIPADALKLFATVKAAGAARPLVIDEDGKRLGTWKVKGRE